MPRTARERSAGLAHINHNNTTIAGGGIDAQRNGGHRQEKIKSSHIYGQLQYAEGRRGSLRPAIHANTGLSPRPALQARTSSAPLLDSGRPIASHGSRSAERAREDSRNGRDGREDNDAAGVAGAMRSFQPFQSPEVGMPRPSLTPCAPSLTCG